ncbi:MAG: hypothetical protein GY874_16030 [Desulfobacteraceae bacterium]|nr:hypothetical protein [Desulfobacteraceae bacterium]
MSALETIKSLITTCFINMGDSATSAGLYCLLIIITPVLILLILIFVMLKRRQKKTEQVPSALSRQIIDNEKILPFSSAPTQTIVPFNNTRLTDKQKVLKFFFNLYKTQIKTPPQVPTELYLIEKRKTCPDETYEMRILKDGDWTSRRMSIGLLGQGGGSRSKCFYVIFDSHMVVKIPSNPILKFSQYNRQIADEADVVARLSPLECIVPKVSVILKTIYSFRGSSKLSPQELEKKYVQELPIRPLLQEHLKIGRSFVFFMDLAKHFFLSTVMDEFHNRPEKFTDEAMQNPELIFDQNGFACRYSEEASSVCHQLQEIYYSCEKILRKIIDDAAIADDIPTFRIKHWFIVHLSGEQLIESKEGLPQNLLEKINAFFIKIIKHNEQTVDTYRQIVNSYIKETHFRKSRASLESLASNTLNLLAWIGLKKLALRDLKPENLFVAGSPDEYPVFLNDTSKFTIGLIDVETAVLIEDSLGKKIPQPQLAGTPLYATPSHLITNDILEKIYYDIAHIFHLQDWYATVAIIFKIFTGKNLFPETARCFPEILNRLELIDAAGQNLETDVANMSHFFWTNASHELRQALSAHQDILTRVEVTLPKKFVPVIIKVLKKDSDRIAQALSNCIEQQTFFPDEKKRNYLKKATASKIRLMKTKLESEHHKRSQSKLEHTKIIKFFSQIINYKYRLSKKKQAGLALKDGTAIAADQLIETMFEYVFLAMHRPNWPELALHKLDTTHDHAVKDISTYQATIL